MDAILSNKLLVLMVFVTFPAILRYSKVLSKNSILWGVLIIIVFTSGSIELLGVPNSVLRFVRELIVYCLAFKAFSNSVKNNNFPGLLSIICFFLISIVSGIVNGVDLILIVVFVRKYLFFPLLFYILINYQFSYSSYKNLNKLVIGLLVAQIFANVVKYFLVGITEPVIGTMQLLGGAATTTIGLIGLTYFLSLFLVFGHRRYIFLAIGFVFFAILGGKRAMVAFTPIILMVNMFFYFKSYRGQSFKIFKYSIFTTIFILFASYMVVRFSPSLNPEHRLWGSFDFDYLVEYSDWYLNDYERDGVNHSRGKAPELAFAAVSQGDWINTLFGVGAGAILESNFNSEIKGYSDYFDYLSSTFGLGYGSMTGVIMIFVQTGFLGTAFYCLFLLSMFISIYKKSILYVRKFPHSKFYVFRHLVCVSTCFVFAIMFFGYTEQVIDNYVSAFVIIWLTSASLIGNSLDKSYNELY
jgi:hypothetical protein